MSLHLIWLQYNTFDNTALHHLICWHYNRIHLITLHNTALHSTAGAGITSLHLITLNWSPPPLMAHFLWLIRSSEDKLLEAETFENAQWRKEAEVTKWRQKFWSDTSKRKTQSLSEWNIKKTKGAKKYTTKTSRSKHNLKWENQCSPASKTQANANKINHDPRSKEAQIPIS